LILLSIPLATLIGLGVFMKVRLDQIEERGRFVAETQISSLKVAAAVMQTFQELRSDARSYLLGDNPNAQFKELEGFERKKLEIPKLIRQYEDSLVSDDRDRRLTAEVRQRAGEWIAGADQAISLATGGDQKGAVAHLTQTLAPLG